MSGTEMVCPVCSARQDAGLLCASCTDALEHTIGNVRSLVADLDVTLSKQARIGTPGKGGLAREKSPVHFGALEAGTNLLTVLDAWARGIVAMHATQPRTYVHVSTATSAAAFLLGRIDELRRHPDVDKLVTEVNEAVQKARNVIDRPADRQYLGQCATVLPDEYGQDVECTAELWAKVNAETATCRLCGIQHDVAERRNSLIERAKPLIVTVKQACEYIGELGGITVNAKSIRTWIERDKLTDHSGGVGERTIRLGDLMDFLTDKATRSAA